jgi:hypothetical protein
MAWVLQDYGKTKVLETIDTYSNYGTPQGYKKAKMSDKDFENGSLLKNDSDDEEALDLEEDKNET